MSWTYPPTPNEPLGKWVGWKLGIPFGSSPAGEPKQGKPSNTRAADEDVDAIVGTLNLLRMNIIPQNFYTSWWLNQPRKLNGETSSPIFGVKMKYI